MIYLLIALIQYRYDVTDENSRLVSLRATCIFALMDGRHTENILLPHVSYTYTLPRIKT